ncbi:MAG: nucleotide exchange factor GrpE [Coriobacteriales bacterium]|jgi:molecular chaperone GrpE
MAENTNYAEKKAQVDEAVEEAAEPEIVDEAGQDAEDAKGDAGEDAGSPEAEESKIESDTAALEKELADVKDKYIRLQAEWDNYRKRTASERAQERSRANERLVTNLLQVLDDMERAIDNSGVPDDDPMLTGIKAVYSKFSGILQQEGLKVVNPEKGDPFDIQLHQAVSSVEDPSVPDDSVLQVYQKGYTMGDKILRTAMVVVSTGGPKRSVEEAPEEAE